jgi:hypothetical protein
LIPFGFRHGNDVIPVSFGSSILPPIGSVSSSSSSFTTNLSPAVSSVL